MWKLGADLKQPPPSCLISLIGFFLLCSSDFSFKQVCFDELYRRRLAFFGDAVLKVTVIKILMARKGLECPHLHVRTEKFLTNASLSVLFDKLQFKEGIDRALGLTECKATSYTTHAKATYVEAMLGATELLAPQHTCAVVTSMMDMLEGSGSQHKAAPVATFSMKPKDSTSRLQGSGALKSRAASKMQQSEAEGPYQQQNVRSIGQKCKRQEYTQLKAAPVSNGSMKPKPSTYRLKRSGVLGYRAASKAQRSEAECPCQ